MYIFLTGVFLRGSLFMINTAILSCVVLFATNDGLKIMSEKSLVCRVH